MIRFNDGINVPTEGPIRKIRLTDGLYVVGKGMSIPVATDAEADSMIKKMEG